MHLGSWKCQLSFDFAVLNWMVFRYNFRIWRNGVDANIWVIWRFGTVMWLSALGKKNISLSICLSRFARLSWLINYHQNRHPKTTFPKLLTSTISADRLLSITQIHGVCIVSTRSNIIIYSMWYPHSRITFLWRTMIDRDTAEIIQLDSYKVGHNHIPSNPIPRIFNTPSIWFHGSRPDI